MIDKSLSFGLQNYFFTAADETGLVYDYAAYMDKKGGVLIGRYKKDDTEALYYSAVGVFATIWAARTTFTYVLPLALVEPSF
jgi:hypothetical protein